VLEQAFETGKRVRQATAEAQVRHAHLQPGCAQRVGEQGPDAVGQGFGIERPGG